MADNPILTATVPGGLTTVAVAADDVSSVFYQRVKLDAGADGAALPVDVTNPLPVYTPQGSASVVNTKVSVDTTAGGTELLAASASRKGWAVMPEAAMHISVGENTTTNSFQVQPYQVFSPPVNLTGQVKGLSALGTINLTGATVTLLWRIATTGSKPSDKQSAAMTLVTPASGIASYTFTAGQLVAGKMTAEVQITAAGVTITSDDVLEYDIRARV